MKERIYVFDNVKVWLMMMVVLGHTVIASYGSSNVGVAYIWFLGAFILCRYSSLSQDSLQNRGGVNMRKLCKAVLLPFLIFNTIYMFYEPLFTHKSVNWLIPGFSMWFLCVLFAYRLIFPWIIKIKHVLYYSILIALLVGFIPWVDSRLALSRFFCFLPFYLLGYYVNNVEMFRKIKKGILTPFNAKDAIILGGIVVVWAILLYYKPSVAFYTTFNGSYTGNWIFLLVRLAMYGTAFVVGYYVLKMFPNKETFYTKYGSRTMGIYLLHGLVVLPFAYMIFPPFEDGNLMERLLMVLLPVGICLLFFSKPIDKIVKKCF